MTDNEYQQMGPTGPIGPEDSQMLGDWRTTLGPTGPTGAVLANELRLEEEELETLTQGPRYVVPVLAYGLLLAGSIAGVVLAAIYSGTYDYSPNWTEFALPLFSLLIGALISGGAWFLHIRLRRIAEARGRIKALKKLTPEENARTTPRGYFDELVDINVVNLSSYYRLIRRHTDRSYTASLAVAMVSFLLVVAGLVVGVSVRDPGALTIAYVSTGAGILGEFTASVFFYLYSRTVRQLKEYHESLVHVQNILLAFKLVNDIQTPTERLSLFREVIGKLLGKSSS